MRILLTGASGQVGWELRRSLGPLGVLLTPDRSQLDLAQPHTIAPYLMAQRPDLIINPAAYTAVDQAETESTLAQVINADSVGELARASAALDALLVHYSTDYVFDGCKATPYETSDAPQPVSAYGRSKWAGEQAIAAAGGRHLIIRTSWVYGSRGKNFLLTMLRLARERDSLRVVADQRGAPTASRLIADTTAQLLARIAPGAKPPASLLHLTGAGACSWHEFASQIVAWGSELGLCKRVPVAAISTTEFPTPAQRPANSCLGLSTLENAYGLKLPHWRDSLRLTLEDMAANIPR